MRPSVEPNLGSSRFACAVTVAALLLGPALEASALDTTVRASCAKRNPSRPLVRFPTGRPPLQPRP